MYTGDVVLLELDSPLKLNEVVGSVCLTETSSTIDPERLCVTAGWGSDLEHTATTEQYLKYLPVPNVPTDRCNSSIHYNGALPENTICAGYLNSNKTTCYVSLNSRIKESSWIFMELVNVTQLHSLLPER